MTKPTEVPWAVGSRGRCVVKEVSGMADGYDHYMIAVMSAHSELSNLESAANAALIVEAVNNYDRLRKALAMCEGFMLNAKIDLETKTPKRTALNTLEGGLRMVREALR